MRVLPSLPRAVFCGVVATTDLRGVPEGTSGQVRIPTGLTWQRYYVMFDNGINVGSVGHEKLVKEADWPQFQKDRARLAEEATAAEAKRKAEAPAPAVDEHLRSPDSIWLAKPINMLQWR